jgi:DNA invertase Pin-like site-specific DNA recombinase
VPTAIGYVRVSTMEQVLGLEAQRASLQEWATAQRVELLEIHEDRGVSGAAALEDRPGLLRALGRVRELQAECLVVARRDRLARDVVVAATVEALVDRAGASVASADGVGNNEGPEAALFRQIVYAFAQYERALIRSRIKGALRELRARGARSNSTPPYGWRHESGELVEEPAEQEALTAIRRWRGRGIGQTRMVELLVARGFPARGSTWHRRSVQRILARLDS